MTDIKDIIQDKLNENSSEENKDENATKAKESRNIDLNNLSTEQIQNLKELFAKTPQRVSPEQSSHTVQLREIDDKVIVGWEQTFFEKQRDVINHTDVLKTMIPVLFYGDKKYKKVLWREDFMEAKKVECNIVKMETSEERKVVGVTYKRDNSGEKTNEEVERYVVTVNVDYIVRLPDGAEVKINSLFIN